jgi:hypothetical protein
MPLMPHAAVLTKLTDFMHRRISGSGSPHGQDRVTARHLSGRHRRPVDRPFATAHRWPLCRGYCPWGRKPVPAEETVEAVRKRRQLGVVDVSGVAGCRWLGEKGVGFFPWPGRSTTFDNYSPDPPITSEVGLLSTTERLLRSEDRSLSARPRIRGCGSKPLYASAHAG